MIFFRQPILCLRRKFAAHWRSKIGARPSLQYLPATVLANGTRVGEKRFARAGGPSSPFPRPPPPFRARKSGGLKSSLHNPKRTVQ